MPPIFAECPVDTDGERNSRLIGASSFDLSRDIPRIAPILLGPCSSREIHVAPLLNVQRENLQANQKPCDLSLLESANRLARTAVVVPASCL